MLLKKIRYVAVPALLLILLLISILVLANTLIQRPSVQKYLVQRISNFIGIDIRTGEIEVNLLGGIGILVHDFEARSRHGNDSITSARVRIILDGTELIKGRIVPKGISLIQPKIEMYIRDKTEPRTDQKGAEAGKSPLLWVPGIRSIQVEQGRMVFTGRSFYLDDVNLKARETGQYPLTLSLNSTGKVGFRDRKVPFDVSGVVLLPAETMRAPTVDLLLNTGKAPLNWIPWPRSILVEQGSFKASLKIEGTLNETTTVSGQITVDPFQFSLTKGDRGKDFSIPESTLDFRSSIQGKRINFQSLRIKNPDFSLSIGLMLDLKEQDKFYLELSAQTDSMNMETVKGLFPSPLLPLWLGERLLPVLKTGQVRLKLLTLKGSEDQLNRLWTPENRSALKIELECNNLGISGDGIPVPFRGVTAVVAIGDGDLRISGLKAVFGDSMIREAGLIVKGVMDHSPSFEIVMDGSFDLQDLIRQKDMGLITSGVVKGLDDPQGLAGRLDCRARFGYRHGWELPRILGGEFLFQDCTIHRKDLLLPLEVEEARFRVHESGLSGFTGLGSWGNSPFKVTGEFAFKEKGLDFRKADISLNMDLNQVIPRVYQGKGLSVRSREPALFRISMAIKDSSWDLSGDIQLNDIVIESEGIYADPRGNKNRVLFDLRFRPGEMIHMNRILCRLGDSSLEISGDYDFHKKGFSGLDISSSGLSMEDLGIYYIKRDDIPMRGTLRGNVKVTPSGRNIKNADIKGWIEGEGLYFPLKNNSMPVKDCRFHLDFSGRQAAIDDLKMKIGESLLSIRGNLKGWDTLEGDIVVKSDFLNMSDILPEKDVSALPGNVRGRRKGILGSLNLGVKLDISGGMWRKLRYGPLEADLDIKAGDIYINRSTINLEKGVISVKGHVITGDRPESLFSGNIRLADQPVDELQEDIGVGDRGIKGRLTLEGSFLLQGKDKKELISSLTGSGKISLEKGLIRQSRVLIKVLEFLSIQKIFKQRPPDLREEGFYFESMRGDLIVKKGILRSDNLVIRSPIFNAGAYGEMDIPLKSVDFILMTQPLGTIDTLVSNIPILGYIITGDRGSVLAYSFEVKGPISDPQVKFVPFEKLGEGVGGILKRLLLTPKRILEDIDKVTKGAE